MKRRKATISAREWNAALAKFQREQLVQGMMLGNDEWRHPWFTSVAWNAFDARFEALIKPGFVNYLPATVDVVIDGLHKDVPLTDDPRLPLPSWRRIGADAEPVGQLANEDGTVTLSYETVPDFFLALGVSAKTETTLDEGNALDVLAPSDVPPRRLVACDLVLNQDRLGYTTATLGDGLLTVGFTRSPAAREAAYVRAARRYVPAGEPDPVQQLAGNWEDDTRDSELIATVYLLSPERTAADAPPDQTWTPFVQHELFWNLNHDTNDIPPQPNVNPLTLVTGLAGGMADGLIQSMLAANDAEALAALNFLANQRLTGMFWGV